MMKELHITMKSTPSIHEDIHACIGYFDGIHKGHRQLISTVVKRARLQGGIPALITFDPDPWAVIKGMRDIPHLSSMDQRKQIAQDLGIELWIILDFTGEMAALSVLEFHEQILKPLHLKTLVCGYDFHYAHLGSGSVATLQAQSDFEVVVIDEISLDKEKISSSRIERLVQQGNMEKVQELLLRPYQMDGCVVHGMKNGRKIGFPTANLHTEACYVLPKEGVYVGEVFVRDQWHPAMINIGKNPTYGDFDDVRIEAHLFDFNEDIYGEKVTFCFLHYLRGDVKFTGVDQLAEQLQKDKETSLAYLAK